MPFQVLAWVILIEFLRGAAASQICYRTPRDYSASRGLGGKIIRPGCEETWRTKTGIHFLVCFDWYFEWGGIISSRVLPAMEQKTKLGTDYFIFVFIFHPILSFGALPYVRRCIQSPRWQIYSIYPFFLNPRMSWRITYCSKYVLNGSDVDGNYNKWYRLSRHVVRIDLYCLVPITNGIVYDGS